MKHETKPQKHEKVADSWGVKPQFGTTTRFKKGKEVERGRKYHKKTGRTHTGTRQESPYASTTARMTPIKRCVSIFAFIWNYLECPSVSVKTCLC